MTAINIIPIEEPPSVAFLTDGAMFNEADGTIGAIAQKVCLLAHINTVICVRGPSIPIMALWGFYSPAESFEAVLKHLPEFCRLTKAEMPEFELWIAGYSKERGCFESYTVSSVDNHNGAALELVQFEGFGGTPACDWHMPEGRSYDPVKDGIALMEAQRRATKMVGGFVQLTTITPTELTSRVIHRWPDKVGERQMPQLAARNCTTTESDSPESSTASSGRVHS